MKFARFKYEGNVFLGMVEGEVITALEGACLIVLPDAMIF